MLPALLLASVAWSVAWSGPRSEVAEEVIVYADDFARWDGTRWHVQTEVVIPMGITLARDANEGFQSYAMQIRSVLACDKEHRLSKRKWEIGCQIEDIGLLVTSLRQWRRDRDRARVQSVIDEIDAKLTGLRIQLQVDDHGGVTNIDLEGLETRTQRERTVEESLRQVVSRMVAGFHLRIPDHAQRSGGWVEYSSNLMQIPSITGSRGSVMVQHTVTRQEGLQIVQTVGKGGTTIDLPIIDHDYVWQSGPNGEDAGSPQILGLVRTEGSSVEATWAMQAVGVAVFERETGIMSERVWLVTGLPTASAGQGTQLPPYRNAGRLTQLGEADRPAVGPTRQVAPPGRPIDGLPGWVSIETFPE